MKKVEFISKILEEKILVLDGPMGTMIQREGLTEQDFKGEKFKKIKNSQKGNNDLLNITCEKLIYNIHKEYLESGADILETNTFNSTKTSQKDYDCQDFSYELNFQGGCIARRAVDDYLNKNPDEKKIVAGVLGPTNRTCSMSPDVNNPGFRNINFDQLKDDYLISVEALIDSGVDTILIETIFDTLNAKASLMAINEFERKKNIKIPVMISATISDLSGRTLSGQTLEGFYNSVIHCDPLSVGLNCALGPKELEAHLVELNRISEFFVSIHPNAGLPNAFGGYDETPESMAKYVKSWAENSYINIVGGCCGATPEHIKLMKKVVEKLEPRKRLVKNKSLRLSGLEAFNY
jgi:5-methyltetrahydrofolate--homocysteine methyltransferase|tara:strand:+ start:2006 stop:3055 length:1050 start_codon:yes stop_codon:yes gene_type:complete